MDVRYALRTLRKSPAFTLAAVLVLALGIGVTTALFSMVDAVLLRPLPFPEPERLVVLSAEQQQQQGRSRYSLPNYEDLAQQLTQIRPLSAVSADLFNRTGAGDAEMVRGATVVGDFFSAFGVTPLLGRTFTGAERDAPVVVLSHARWLKEGGTPQVLGSTMTLSGQPYTVVGVMPPSFQIPHPSTDVWLPFDSLPGAATSRDRTERGHRAFGVMGRLAPGATLESARHEMKVVGARLGEEKDTELLMGVMRFQDLVTRDVSRLLWVMLGAVSLVLLLAAANVAHLQLARAAARQRELGIRVALGAGRGRLVRQLLTESLLLALMGGVGGVLLALWTTDLVLMVGGGRLPRASEMGLNGRVLAFALGVTLTTGVGVGLLPALRKSRMSPASVLGRGVMEAARSRAHSVLVVAEVALALMLVCGAGLMLKSFWRLYQADPGLDPRGVLVARLALPAVRYGSAEQASVFHQALATRLAARPEIAAVGVGASLPAGGSIGRAGYWAEGTEDVSPRPHALFNVATPGFLEALRVPLLAGRRLAETDGPDAPRVMVISERFAREVFPGQDAVGRRVTFGGRDEDGKPLWTTVVGVVRDVAYAGITAGHEPTVYVPMSQEGTTDGQLAVRAAGDLAPQALEAVVREELRAVDSMVALAQVATLEERLSTDLGLPRFRAVLLGAFGVLALVLAAVGIYGVMSYSVAQREQEMGVRLALGARSADVLRLVVGQSLRRVGWGLGLGLVGTLSAHRAVEGLLYGMEALDVGVMASVCLLLLVTAWLASWLPARRAAGVDPASVLRGG
ncbi:ABC transporter permease [Myxococcus landrumensis]|uniref:ABC transporter permease n=1 Tax=Myxococcus landrumensis TaxID=2813577 RepID=A0ABX7N1F8_9BACT|nr:ABC transporter permease [Myxococcus landrumus]QSQ12313.1 ABC transporter permease [Myxococcus landrumus]